MCGLKPLIVQTYRTAVCIPFFPFNLATYLTQAVKGPPPSSLHSLGKNYLLFILRKAHMAHWLDSWSQVYKKQNLIVAVKSLQVILQIYSEIFP